MKKFNFIKMSALVLSVLAVFSACSGGGAAPSKSPEEVVKEGMNNLSDVKSVDYKFSAKGLLSVDEATAETAGFSKIDVDSKFSGSYDISNLDNAKFALILDLGLNKDGGKDERAKAEIRFVKDTVYLVLSEISDFDGELPKEMIAGFINQWWSMPLPAESLDDMFAQYKDEANMTEQEKALKDLYKNTMLFKDIKYEKNEKAGGVNAYKYSVTLDKEAVKAYIAEVAKIMGETVTETDLGDVSTFLGFMDFSGSLWIGQDDMTFRKFSGTVSVKDLEGVTADLDVDYEVSNLGSATDVAIPEGATEFNPMMLLGGGL